VQELVGRSIERGEEMNNEIDDFLNYLDEYVEYKIAVAMNEDTSNVFDIQHKLEISLRKMLTAARWEGEKK
jgi:hypothetical protein